MTLACYSLGVSESGTHRLFVSEFLGKLRGVLSSRIWTFRRPDLLQNIMATAEKTFLECEMIVSVLEDI